uniref:Uncharacterized protein n=1 Tax=Nelumbo nucifera TaxID=4432 RepID=A0A822XJE2_NELNU|nr:TPA_asm: hypothetical protein HUJ06_021860 [Nelumbo nucifera]DAD43486.1 TPA_asm: hypothetical protein HUJ06_001716 [Nelumbo nucifera]
MEEGSIAKTLKARTNWNDGL